MLEAGGSEIEAWLAAGEQAGAPYLLTLPHRPARGAAGLTAGRRAGSSLEFQEHRPYQPGDDLRRLDWSAYARSDRLALKLYHEEVTPHLDLLVDGSRSMAALPAKAQAVVALLALLRRAAANAGYSQALWWAGETCRRLPAGQVLPASGTLFESTASAGEALRRRPPAWRWGGVRLLLSDLLWSEPPRETLAALGRGAAAVVVVQVLAAQEEAPSFDGSLWLEDCESGQRRQLWVDEGARRAYREALGRHRQAWRRAARGAGARFVDLVAEDVVNGWRLEPLLREEVLRVA